MSDESLARNQQTMESLQSELIRFRDKVFFIRLKNYQIIKTLIFFLIIDKQVFKTSRTFS